MNDPFSKLKESMKKTVFNDFSFSEDRKKTVKDAIHNQRSKRQLHMWSEQTVYHVLASLQQERRNGFDISTYLFQLNDDCFKNKEGQLYSLLHLLESRGVLSSTWVEEEGRQTKYYSLTNKGSKILAAQKLESSLTRTSLKHLIEEASL
ncbi:PadR family transcriptional regulator [Bacillus sp. JCM 19034]|uniref:PadR family transcriptional regulator n=1 Tax=Bacillus sp. JCM 19034 TaxID=1481928 RepID=UPI000783F455|nr:PadR family transcriptional regulator [Bacillus sp. JCM 19034]